MWSKEEIAFRLKQNDTWLERAVVAIFNQQTTSEQKSEVSVENNHRGFSGPDAHRLSYYAKWILAGKHLSGPHREIARKRIIKYAGQLAKIANGGLK